MVSSRAGIRPNRDRFDRGFRLHVERRFLRSHQPFRELGGLGTFQFTSVGGQVQFVALSTNPVNITLSGTWSAVLW